MLVQPPPAISASSNLSGLDGLQKGVGGRHGYQYPKEGRPFFPAMRRREIPNQSANRRPSWQVWVARQNLLRWKTEREQEFLFLFFRSRATKEKKKKFLFPVCFQSQ